MNFFSMCLKYLNNETFKETYKKKKKKQLNLCARGGKIWWKPPWKDSWARRDANPILLWESQNQYSPDQAERVHLQQASAGPQGELLTGEVLKTTFPGKRMDVPTTCLFLSSLIICSRYFYRFPFLRPFINSYVYLQLTLEQHRG